MQSHDLKNITSAQMRAGRALLRWSAEDLARQSRLGVATIRRAEAQEGSITATYANVQSIREAFEAAGVEIIPENGGGAGVRFRQNSRAVEGASESL